MPTEENGQMLSETWKRLSFPKYHHDHPPVQNANQIHQNSLSPLDKMAITITDKVGSVGFFLIIFTWTICWTSYNVLATVVPALHWKAFDPFPAFVAYLLISNVIQILLMPMIMVGQNLQNRASEARAEMDFAVNKTAEKEVAIILKHLEHNTELLIQLMRHVDCKIAAADLEKIASEMQIMDELNEISAKLTRE